MDTAIDTHTGKSEKKLYGKRPLWQWAAIYLVIGAIVYGAVYFFFLNKEYGYSNSNATNSSQTQQQKPY